MIDTNGDMHDYYRRPMCHIPNNTTDVIIMAMFKDQRPELPRCKDLPPGKEATCVPGTYYYHTAILIFYASKKTPEVAIMAIDKGIGIRPPPSVSGKMKCFPGLDFYSGDPALVVEFKAVNIITGVSSPIDNQQSYSYETAVSDRVTYYSDEEPYVYQYEGGHGGVRA